MNRENHPDHWKSLIPPKRREQNKYDHGHLVVYGGRVLTGAARMAADAGMRVGAGLCTVTAHPAAFDVYRAYKPYIMVEICRGPGAFGAHIKDGRRNAVVIGPGAGLDVRPAVRKVCKSGKPCVIDADALTVFQDRRTGFYKLLHKDCVLTPHEGEFERVFPNLSGSREARAAEAARLTGAVILLKGAQTVIAGPDQRLVISDNGPPDLATGGAGDVLAGIIGGLLARGVPAFEAACAGAWIHGRAAQLFGPGLVATDIIDGIPAVLRELT